MAKMIAVIGSPGSGKTTVTLKLAQELYCATTNGAVIYLSPSLKVPAIGVLFPNYTPDSIFSLGEMLDKTDIYEEDILNHLVTVKAMNNFGCLGYKAGENRFSFPVLTEDKVKSLFDVLHKMAGYVFVDCIVAKIMATSGLASIEQTVLPDSIIQAIEDSGFWESVPLWAVTLIGSLFITVLSFIMIMTVYGRFFKIYLYTAIAPVPLSSFAGEPSSGVGKSFIKSYAAVCLEGAIIVLGCIIFSLFAASPPVVDETAAAVNQVWSYVGELIFNMIVLVGTVKMSDRVVKEMMGL